MDCDAVSDTSVGARNRLQIAKRKPCESVTAFLGAHWPDRHRSKVRAGLISAVATRRQPKAWDASPRYTDKVAHHAPSREATIGEQQGSFDDVQALVEHDLVDDGCLLMAAVAARGAGQMDKSNLWANQLKHPFDETRQRGDQPHRRFVARYYLDLANDPKMALSESLDNWEKQKELVDARLVLRSATAAGRPESAQGVIGFLGNASAKMLRRLS